MTQVTTMPIMQAQAQAIQGQAQVAQAQNTGTNKPTFGGIIGTAVWIGGPPKADWSDSSFRQFRTPLCICRVDPVSKTKGYVKHVGGTKIKFKANDPEYPFAYDEHCEQAWDEFKEFLLNSADESLKSSV